MNMCGRNNKAIDHPLPSATRKRRLSTITSVSLSSSSKYFSSIGGQAFKNSGSKKLRVLVECNTRHYQIYQNSFQNINRNSCRSQDLQRQQYCFKPICPLFRLLFMSKILLGTVGLLLNLAALTQQLNLDQFNKYKQQINKSGLLVIGSWSAANIIYGSIASSKANGSARYFHQMNAIWNTVTLGLSTIGYLSAKKEDGLTYSSTLRKQAAIEKIFLVNAGLDVAYIATGFYMKERAKSNLENKDKNKGYGESIILQGSVLLLFDIIMYGVHNKHGDQLFKLADKLTFAATTYGVGFVVEL